MSEDTTRTRTLVPGSSSPGHRAVTAGSAIWTIPDGPFPLPLALPPFPFPLPLPLPLRALGRLGAGDDDGVEFLADVVDEQRRLHGVQRQPLQFRGQLVRGAHDGREGRQRLPGPGRNFGAVAQGLADHQHEAVDQPPQRRRGMGVGGADGGLDGGVAALCRRSACIRHRGRASRPNARWPAAGGPWGPGSAGTRRSAFPRPRACRGRGSGGGSGAVTPRPGRAWCAGCRPCPGA